MYSFACLSLGSWEASQLRVCVGKCPCPRGCIFSFLLLSPSVLLLKVTSSFIPGGPFCVLHGYCYLCVLFPLLSYITVHCSYRWASSPTSQCSLELILCQSRDVCVLSSHTVPITSLLREFHKLMSPARVGAFRLFSSLTH